MNYELVSRSNELGFPPLPTSNENVTIILKITSPVMTQCSFSLHLNFKKDKKKTQFNFKNKIIIILKFKIFNILWYRTMDLWQNMIRHDGYAMWYYCLFYFDGLCPFYEVCSNLFRGVNNYCNVTRVYETRLYRKSSTKVLSSISLVCLVHIWCTTSQYNIHDTARTTP